MRIIVDKLEEHNSSVMYCPDRMVFEISDDMLLKLGKKYFELASKSATSTYVNEQPDLGTYTTISTKKSKESEINGITDGMNELFERYGYYIDFLGGQLADNGQWTFRIKKKTEEGE